MPVSSTQSRPASAARKLSQVYIDIPPSPLHMHEGTSSVTSSIKENTPLLPTRTSSGSSSLTSVSSGVSRPNKRKLSDASTKMPQREQSEQHPKKAKLAAPRAAPTVKGAIKKQEEQQTSATDSNAGSSSNVLYCHQCNKKRDIAGLPSPDTSVTKQLLTFITDVIRCTYRLASPKLHQCGAKYCRACLKNRYAQSLDEIKVTDVAKLSKKERESHFAKEGYYFKCVDILM